MQRTTFETRYGTEQGRLSAAVGHTAPEGDWLYVLGSDPTGHAAELAPGDFTEISQVGTFGNAKMVRSQLRLRGPREELAGDLRWVAQLRIDDVVVVERDLPPRRTITIGDVGWCVSTIAPDPHKIAFRLMLRGSTEPPGLVEIPAFYIDALVLDGAFAPRPQILNRNPAPGETRVPTSSTVQLDLVDVGGAGVDESATEVYVNGVLAFDGGAFESGFDGPASSSDAIDAHTRRLVIDPTDNFASEEQVVVRVVSAVSGGPTLETTYTFQIEDAAAPRILSAISSSETAVRLVWNEAMDPTSTLDPTAFTFARAPGAIAVPVEAVAVRLVSDVEIEVELDQEITPGALYTVTAVGPKDQAGNATTAPHNAATFAGYACNRPDDREWSIFELFPQLNQTEDEGDLARFAAVLQEVCDLILCKIDRFAEIVDPDTAPIAFIDAMLADLGNPFDFDLSEIDRRRLVQILVEIYKQKGTGPGIVAAIRFFLSIEVALSVPALAPLGLGDWELGEDWILGSSDLTDLLTFEIVVPRPLTAAERSRMTWIATYMRTEREHFRIVEPAAPPPVIDHLELGESELGATWQLHA